MKKKEKGSVTIFLTLTLMILLSFLCTALRSAQTAGSRYLFTVAADAVTGSVFGAYDTLVWEQYRILMLADRELANKIGQECAQVYEKNGTMFPLENLSVELTDGITLAQNGAVGWEDGMVSYMSVRLPVEMVSDWLEQMDWLDGLKEVTAWLEGVRDLIGPLIQLEQRLCDLEERLEEAVETYERGKALLNELISSCEAVKQLLVMAEAEVQGGDFDEAAFDAAWASLEDSFQKIQKYVQDSGWELDMIEERAARDLQSADSLRQLVNGLMTSLAGTENSGLWELADLGGYLSGLKERFGFLESLPTQLRGQKEYLLRISQMSLPSAQEIRDGLKTEAMEFLQGLAEGFVSEVWGVDILENDEGSAEDDEQLGILMSLRSWLDQGILGLILESPGQVSQAKLGRTLERSERSSEQELLETAYRKALSAEYILRYAACGGEGGSEINFDRSAGAGLQYETEYVIAGNAQDSANLAAVASRLLLARGALNLVYLMQNASSQEGLRLTAAGISAALGGWIPQGLMTVILMVVWAMAEAVCDVRALLSGKKVPFWKDQSSWKLAWENLWTLLDDGFVTGMDRENGLSYQEYLRLLLYLVPSEELCYRMMEVAEENLREQRKDFCIDQGWSRATVVLTGQAGGRQTQLRLAYGYGQ